MNVGGCESDLKAAMTNQVPSDKCDKCQRD